MSTFVIQHMSRAEKLQAMEALWESLCLDDQALPSPDWHAVILRETEARHEAGQEPPMDWADAKQELCTPVR
jgi:hypothetical protein